jgi:hypothetical protein
MHLTTARRCTALVAVIAAVGAVLSAVIFATRSEGTAALTAMSNRGSPVSTPQTLSSRADARRTWKLGERSNLTFYRFIDGNGRECFAVLPTSFGVSCELNAHGAFPSVRYPLLYSYGVEIEKPTGKTSVLDVTGFAADSVAKIAALDSAGNVVTSSAVTDNIFSFDVKGPAVVQVVAYGADGNTVYSSTKRR